MKVAKAFYFGQLVLAAVAALILGEYGGQASWLHTAASFTGVCAAGDDGCFGNSLVFRVSFGTAMYFLAMLAFSFAGKEAYTGYWGLKIVLHAALCVGALFIDAEVFNTWASISAGASVLFLLLMVVVLLDFAYTVHEGLVLRMEAEEEAAATAAEWGADAEQSSGCCSCCAGKSCWKPLYLSVVLVLWFGSLATLGWLYAYSHNQREVYCGWNLGVLSITLVSGVVYTVLSVTTCLSRDGTPKGLLPAAIIFTYTTYLTWTAIHSSPKEQCDPLHGADKDASAAAGIIITGLTLGWTAFSATSSLPSVFDTPPPAESDATAVGRSGAGHPKAAAAEEDLTTPAMPAHGATAAPAPASESGLLEGSDSSAGVGDRVSSTAYGGREPEGQRVAAPWAFHIVMILASTYMAMLLTNWTLDAARTASRHTAGNFFVNAAACWATILLYGWTLIAEVACPGRDFKPARSQI